MDDPYAQIAKPVDPYASMGTSASAVDERDNAPKANLGFFGPLQDKADELQHYVAHPEERGAGPQTPASKFAAGVVGGSLGTIAHPVQAVKGIGKLITDPEARGDVGRSFENDPAGFAGNIVGGLGLGEGLSAVRGVGSAMRSGGASLDNAAIGTTASDMEHGGNPGRALATNRVVGSNAATIAPKLKPLIEQVANEHRGIVGASTAPPINTGPLVSKPFQDIVSEKTDPRVGAAMPSQVNRANLTERGLTHVPDPVTGKPTANMRDPMLTPLEVTKLKSNIYDMADYDNPSQSALANKGLKGAAHNLKTAVETAVPESVDAGQRLHDLMTAKGVLEPSARLVKLPTSKSGILDRAATLAGTGTAAGLDVTGAGLQNVGRYLNAPPMRAGVAIAPIGRRKEQSAP